MQQPRAGYPVSAPVVVVGASLAGMAASARLAKAGHQVVLLEHGSNLGGRWATSAIGTPGALAPILTFPAPWRDLFRKSGRPLDAELARAGLVLEPAPPAVHVFADGSRLALPTERGAQWNALTAAYGQQVAARWRDLLDRLDRDWQLLRHLGIEDEDDILSAARRAQLRARVSVADLARELDHPHLSALLRSNAWRLGSHPERTPGWLAVRLSVDRSFGRWTLTRRQALQPAQPLIDLLAQRLRDRGVDVRLGAAVTSLGPHAVEWAGEHLEAAAVVCTTNVWTFLDLCDQRERGLARRLRWAHPALAPAITTRPDDARWTGEIVRHTDTGPLVEYGLPHPDGTLVVVHDHSRARPDPGAGLAWNGWRTWRRMPPIRTATPGVYLAGSSSRGGNDPWAQVLSGAIATYAVHQDLIGEDIRPTNKVQRTP